MIINTVRLNFIKNLRIGYAYFSIFLLITFAFCYFVSFILLSSNSFAESTHLDSSYSADANNKNSSQIRQKLLLDIGSSATKAALYKINEDTKEVLDVKKTVKHMNYQSCMMGSKNHSILNQGCINKGLGIVNTITAKEFKVDCKKIECIGFVTAWGRAAENFIVWKRRMESIGFKIHLITQKEEGDLAFNAATYYVKDDHNKLVVLDIGGGSTQFRWLDKGSKKDALDISGFDISYGTDNFTYILLKQYFNKDYHHAELKVRPVFFSQTNYDKIRDYVVKFWDDELKKNLALEDKFKNTKGTKLILTGPIARYNLNGQLAKYEEFITIEEIERLAKSFNGKNIQEVMKLYPNTPRYIYFSSQSTLLILYAIMKNLNLNKLYLANHDVLDYLVTDTDHFINGDN